MLWKSSALKGCAIVASDGKIGTVSDFLFDDATWLIRWMVVDTGTWLTGRKVLLPPSVMGHADAVEREFQIKLTQAEVENSPKIDTDLPVSRQMETDVYGHYGWSPYWGGYSSWLKSYNMGQHSYGLGAIVANPELGSRRDHSNDDPNLRSMEAVVSYHIHATDGEIGHISDVLVEDADWSVHYLVVDTRNWWPGQHVLISPHSVRDIRWTERLVYVDADREKIKTSPPYDPALTIDRAYEAKFHEHYVDDAPVDRH